MIGFSEISLKNCRANLVDIPQGMAVDHLASVGEDSRMKLHGPAEKFHLLRESKFLDNPHALKPRPTQKPGPRKPDIILSIRKPTFLTVSWLHTVRWMQFPEVVSFVPDHLRQV